MAPRGPFIEEDDTEDSISVTSTVSSEEQDTYDVEQVLYEMQKGKETLYLIQWEGYSLDRATWEPKAHITHGVILEDWEKRKQAIADGKAKGFVLSEFYKAASEAADKKEDRRQRRRAKRIKRGLPVEDDDKGDEAVQPPTLAASKTKSKKSRRASESPVKRKGVAQKVDRRKELVEVSSDSESFGDDSDVSSTDSLFHELKDGRAKQKERRKPESSARPLQRRAVPSTAPHRAHAPESMSAPTLPLSRTTTKEAIPAPKPRSEQQGKQPPSSDARKPSSSRPNEQSSKKPETVPASVAMANQVKATPSSSTAPALPIKAAAKRLSGANLSNHWTAEKTKRIRTAGELAQDSRYSNLQHENRAHKRRNQEPAPDISSMVFIDARTGQPKGSSGVSVSVTTTDAGRSSLLPMERDKGAESATLPGAQAPSPSVASSTATAVGAVPQSHPPLKEPRSANEHSVPPSIARMAELPTRVPQERRASIPDAMARSAAPVPVLGEPKSPILDPMARSAAPVQVGGEPKAPKPDTMARSTASAPVPRDPNAPIPDASARPVARPPTQAASGNIHPAYGRRTPPPAERMQAPPSPITFEPRPQVQASTSTGGPPKRLLQSLDNLPSFKARATCYYWDRDNTCRYSDENCHYVHGYHPALNIAQRPLDLRTAPIDKGPPPDLDPEVQRLLETPQSETTCWYWGHYGRCNKGFQCRFAHRHTGVMAGQPGSYRDKADMARVAMSRVAVPGQGARNLAPPNERPSASDISMSPTSYNEPERQSPLVAEKTFSEANTLPVIPRRNTATLTHDVHLQIDMQMGKQQKTLPCKFEVTHLATFNKLIASADKMVVKRAILAGDLEALLSENVSGQDIQSVGGIKADYHETPVLETLAEYCIANECCLIADVQGRQTKGIVYPGNAERWAFLGSVNSVNSVLLYRLLPEAQFLEQTQTDPMAFPGAEASDSLWIELQKLNSTILLDAKPDGPKRRLVFIIMPSRLSVELQTYAKYFASLGCKVLDSSKPGSWDKFCGALRESEPGLIVVHPDVSFCKVPGLHNLLRTMSHEMVQVYSIGINYTITNLRGIDPEYATFGAELLFPRGQAALLTDEVLLFHPEHATQFILHFVKSTRAKPPGTETSKIVTRPAIKSWLRDLAGEREASHKDGARYAKLYDAICQLCPTEDEDLGNYDSPLPTANLVSLPDFAMPSLYSLTGDERADWLVGWFAGWAEEHASRFRRFVVLYQQERGELERDEFGRHKMVFAQDPRGWAKQYQHIGVVKPTAFLKDKEKR